VSSKPGHSSRREAAGPSWPERQHQQRSAEMIDQLADPVRDYGGGIALAG
jgi:hypothetical protein